MSEHVPYCSFCGKSKHEVAKLIAGLTVFICDECTRLATNIIDEDIANKLNKEGKVFATLETSIGSSVGLYKVCDKNFAVQFKNTESQFHHLILSSHAIEALITLYNEQKVL